MFGFRDFNPGGVLHTFPYLLDVFSTVHDSRDRPAELPAAEEELWRTKTAGDEDWGSNSTAKGNYRAVYHYGRPERLWHQRLNARR